MKNTHIAVGRQDSVHVNVIMALYAGPVSFVLRNDKIIVFIVLVLAALGLHAYSITARSIFPTMSFSRIDVVADVGDLPPEQVRIAAARPLEQAFQALPSVINVFSTASQGSAELRVDFSPGTDPRADLQYVYQAITQLRSTLPAASNVVAVIVNPNSEPIVSYALTSSALSQTVLRELALTQIVPKLYGIAGLQQLLVAGGANTEYHVLLNPAKLAAQGLGAADVSKALMEANTVTAVGTTQRFYQRYAIIIDSSLHDRNSLAQVMIPLKSGASVPLWSLGSVTLGTSPLMDQASYNGRHAVILSAYGLPGADTVVMASLLREKLDRIIARLPSGIEVHRFHDQTTLIVASQNALRDAIMLGAFLAIAIIYVFLRNFRLTLVAATMIPLAMAIAIFVLHQAGQTLNLMSVGGLAVAVGLIIDDAIVVIENIARNYRADPKRAGDETIELAMTQLSRAMIASSMTTLVVFLPLALLSGVSGYFFRALALTLSGSLIVSLALALLFAPIVARSLMPLTQSQISERGFNALLERYHSFLRWALARRALVMLVSANIMALTLLLLTSLPSDFLPKMDEGEFEIGYTMPTGTTLDASDAAATRMEQLVIADPAVASVGRLTGINTNGFSPTQMGEGTLQVRLVEPTRRENYTVVSARLRERLEQSIPASRFDFHQILEDLINDTSGAPAAVEISVRGNDQQTLIRLAQQITARISSIHGVVDAASGVVYDIPSLRITPDGARLAALGLSSSDVAAALDGLSQGTVATSLPGVSSLIPVRVKVGNDEVPTDFWSGSPALFAKGFSTSIADVARLTPVRLSSNLYTQNGQQLLRVTANIEGMSLSQVIGEIRNALDGVALPPGYSADIGGQALAQRQSFTEFLNAITLAIVLVFAVMLATFRSFRLPLVILTAVPLALIGVALGLFLTGSSFNVSSFMGLLLLVGVVVKNGILLVDVANKRREEGASVEEALTAAGTTRLRPILMTTLATIAGLFPLALGLGQGAEMEQALAVAVIGGLSTSTLFTLVVIPVLYAVFIKEEPLRSQT